MLPKHFVKIEKSPLTLWIRKEYLERLIDQGIERIEVLIENSIAEKYFDGRGLLKSLEIKDSGGERMVIRSYLHGGLYGLINKDLFWGKFRPLKELVISDEVSKRGIATALILAALSKKISGPFYKSKIITKEISNAVDLVNFLQKLKEKSEIERLKIKFGLIKCIAATIRKMHDQGVYHADLHLKNVMVHENPKGDFAIYLIDFDKSVIREKITLKERIKNLMRFNRSAEKMKMKGLPITYSDQWKFLREYFKNNEEIIRSVKKLIRLYLLKQRFHQIGWRVVSFFG